MIHVFSHADRYTHIFARWVYSKIARVHTCTFPDQYTNDRIPCGHKCTLPDWYTTGVSVSTCVFSQISLQYAVFPV